MKIVLKLLLCSFSILIFSQPVFAGDTCQLGVMLIEGKKEAVANSRSAIPKNVRKQLDTLPFSDFLLLQRRSELSKFGEKTFFSLRDAKGGIHQLELTPLEVASNKVHGLVLWKGPSNSTLLRTKLWIENGKSIVVGAEMDDSNSLILDISIDCN